MSTVQQIQDASCIVSSGGLPMLDLDMLFSIANRKDGKLCFEILEQRKDGNLKIRLLLRSGTLKEAILILEE